MVGGGRGQRAWRAELCGWGDEMRGLWTDVDASRTIPGGRVSVGRSPSASASVWDSDVFVMDEQRPPGSVEFVARRVQRG
eukprot:COSAG01_NODE_1838_length_9083_cov_3.184328_2_plen_80_part_00